MQKIETYIRANTTNGSIVDAYNSTTTRKISILRGMQAELIIQMFNKADSSDSTSKYTAEDLADFTTWKMYADVDYNQETSLKLLVDSDDITIGEDGRVHLKIQSTNTETLSEAIGSNSSLDLICELLGYEEDAEVPSFALHFPMTILNRVGMDGSETPVPASGVAGALAELFIDFSNLSDNPNIDEIVEKLSTLIAKIKGE